MLYLSSSILSVTSASGAASVVPAHRGGSLRILAAEVEVEAIGQPKYMDRAYESLFLLL